MSSVHNVVVENQLMVAVARLAEDGIVRNTYIDTLIVVRVNNGR